MNKLEKIYEKYNKDPECSTPLLFTLIESLNKKCENVLVRRNKIKKYEIELLKEILTIIK